MGYPNMSYCMCENTLAAMRQIMTAMREEGVDFLMDMSSDERRAFQELFNTCEDFMTASEQLQEEYEEYAREMDDTVSEQQEWADFDPDC
jgi:transcription termination factor NusB